MSILDCFRYCIIHWKKNWIEIAHIKQKSTFIILYNTYRYEINYKDLTHTINSKILYTKIIIKKCNTFF
jgi:hypothetical protein